MPSATSSEAANATISDETKRPSSREKNETPPSQPTIAESGPITSPLRMFA